jgi:hypothetical protein
MDALHKALRRIHADPSHPTAAALKSLIESLDGGRHLDVSRLYALGYSDFGLALEVMREWRLASFRYERGWASKAAGDRMSLGDKLGVMASGEQRGLFS